MGHKNAGRAGGRPQYHYACSKRRRHGSGACRSLRFHDAEEIRGRRGSSSGYFTIPTPSSARDSISMNKTGRLWGASKRRPKFCWTR